MEDTEIHTRLIQLVQSSNYYNLNPIIPIPDCSEEINMIVQLLENGYAIDMKTRTEINTSINRFKLTYNTYYTDDLLYNFECIHKSMKILLGINKDEPLYKYGGGIIHPRYLDINLNAGVDGTTTNIVCTSTPVCDCILRNGKRSELFTVSMTNDSFIRFIGQPITQKFFISHELSHLTLPTFLDKFNQELYRITTSLGIGMNSHAIELFCDIIGIAVIFITLRRDESIVALTGMTINETNIYNNLNMGNLIGVFGGGDWSHPNTLTRVTYARETLQKLKGILNFDVNNPIKIEEIRNILCFQMMKFLQQCRGINDINRYTDVSQLPPNRCDNNSYLPNPPYTIVSPPPILGIRQDLIDQLTNMGYTEAQARDALTRYNNDFDLALEYLITL